MQPGRKADPPATALARGTFKATRHAERGIIVVPGDPPQMPDYLNDDPEAVDVWQETLPRVMQIGASEPDSSFLARYCAAEAQARLVFKNGGMLTAPMLTALRQMEELLGIAGPKSRIGRVADGKSSNPFARNGRR